MKDLDLKMILFPVVLMISQVIILISGLQFMQVIQSSFTPPTNSLSSLFWQYTLNSSGESIQPTILTAIIWFFGPILMGLIFALQYRGSEIENSYSTVLKIQGVILIGILEFISLSYAYLISSIVSKPLIEAFLALNLYYILPLVVTCYFIAEAFDPHVFLPRNEARFLAVIFIVMLYFVYVITLSIGTSNL